MGNCRKSCKSCESCRRGDTDCINRNRDRGGFWKLNREELESLGVSDLMQDEESPEL